MAQTRLLGLLRLLLPIIASAGVASAQIIISDEVVPEFAALEATGEFVLEQLPEDPEGGVNQSLINGQVVNRADFPAVLRMTTGGTCTAAVVGPATILFAAHCLLGGDRISFTTGSRTVRGRCTVAPGFNPSNLSNDWALCLLENSVGNITFETIDVAAKPGTGDMVLLTGYGCTQPGGSVDGRLRAGFSDIVPRPAQLAAAEGAIYTRASVSQGEVMLCPGDSGGPLFRSGADLSGSRQIVAVNSGVKFELGVSAFAATASATGAAFVRGWAQANNQKICGVNLDLGCR